MLPFEYSRPTRLDELFEMLAAAGGEARLLAGGTDLIVGLRHHTVSAGYVIDLKGIAELHRGISQTADELVVPAGTTMTALTLDDRVRRHFPALVQAASVVGSRQIRNRATLGGNLCNASPAADTVPVLALYGATIVIQGSKGQRALSVQEFIRGNRDIALSAEELVVDIRIPIAETPSGSAFGRITRRKGVDLATVNLSCRIWHDGQVSFALGAVAPRPLLVEAGAGELPDTHADQAEMDAVLERLMTAATPIDDVRASAGYRQAMLTVLARRTLARARENLISEVAS